MTRQEVIKVLDSLFLNQEEGELKTALDITIEVLTENVTDRQVDHTVSQMQAQGVL